MLFYLSNLMIEYLIFAKKKNKIIVKTVNNNYYLFFDVNSALNAVLSGAV